MRALSLLITLFIIMSPLFAADVQEAWQLITADVTLIKDDAKELKVEGTVYGKLLELNKRSLWSMMEEDGTVLTLVISYTPVDQNKPIKQIGFYRTFSLTLQHELEAQKIWRKPIQTKIVYLRANPLDIRFFIRGTLMNVPPLLTKPD